MVVFINTTEFAKTVTINALLDYKCKTKLAIKDVTPTFGIKIAAKSTKLAAKICADPSHARLNTTAMALFATYLPKHVPM